VIEKRATSLTIQTEELKKNKDALAAEIAARNTELSGLKARVASLKTDLGQRTAELKSQVQLSAQLQQEVIKGLKPEAAVLAQRLIDAAKTRGIDVKVISGYRAPEEQQKLVEQHLTRAKKSAHNTGLAFDVGIFRDNKYVDEDPAYDIVGQIGKGLGLVWGGDWTAFPDTPHFETQNARQVLQNQKP
jgi:peptidoglycan L-alanyl-D-glutamate endopeptidase CwlK